MASPEKLKSDFSAGKPADPGLPAIAPDVVEQDFPDQIDEIVPTSGYEKLPMVALGGSAGSISALQRFFEKMPADSGFVFVVILHLSPEHESTLAELLQRSTSMPVRQAEDGRKVEANTVYVIPPGKHLASVDGHLRLIDFQAERGKRTTIDLFFRTLADTHGPHSTAIVLSGADSDGTVGIKRVKERGGLTIAQDPEEAEHGSMPRSAINTGMVDWVLAVQQMPARLIEYFEHERHLKLPPEDGPQPAAPPPAPPDAEERALREVLAFLRARTGRDFSYYKRATIVRRVSRRLQVNGIATLGEYLEFMRTHAGESGALLQDLLISVTNFFRDRDSFDALQARIPELFAGKVPGDVVRVWVPACATGEEAYSIAMLLMEHAALVDAPPSIQVFATDLDDDVIATARAAVYPPTIAADVSDERLRRFFSKDQRGYQVRRDLRECVLFAAHDLLKDAPFSRLDLVSCRNLLIYLTSEAQKRAMEIFHFALRSKALLFLGSSESTDEEDGLFTVVDKKHRLYRQVPTLRGGLIPVPIGPSTVARAVAAQERARGGPFVHGESFERQAAITAKHDAELDGLRAVSWEELHFKLIERFAPPSLIVTRDYEIMHISENAGRFLHFTSGEPSVNLLHVVHPMLRIELRAALFRAAQTNAPVDVFQVPVDLEGKTVSVDIRVAPAQEIAPDYLLVVLSPRESTEGGEQPVHLEVEPAVRHLERENEQMKVRLRDTVEQYEASTEELKASNEELQAMNEELRSATEELETSREELQSINEELTTVNAELKSKVDDLGHSNSDLANLMAATAIATMFLDRSLRIMRYTPAVAQLFRLIPSDIGRPLTDLTHRLNYPELKADAERVIESLAPMVREVSDGEGHWYLARLLPYRTEEDLIAGAVLTFVDITASREAGLALREAEERMRFATEAANIYGWETDPETLKTEYAGNTERVLGFPLPQEVTAVLELIHPDDHATVESAFEDALKRNGKFDLQFRFINPKTGDVVWQSSHGVFAQRADGTRRFVGITQNITERKRAENALRESQERLRLIVENAREYVIFSTDLERRVTSWNAGAERILGYSEGEILGQLADVIFTPEDRARRACEREMEIALAEGRAADERWHVRKDGTRFWGSGNMMPMRDGQQKVIGLVKIFRDQTAAREAQRALERSLQETERARAEAEAAGRAKDHFLAVLSHELRTPLTPILMIVDTLACEDDLPATVREALEIIRRNVEVESHLIKDLLDVTRITRGKFEITREPVDLHEAIRRAVAITEPEIRDKDQQLTVELGAAHHATVGDYTRLQQVVWNLLKNASKFTPEQGKIRLRTRNEPGKFLVEVEDSGIGIAPDAVAHIFDAFAQANEAIAREYGGLGLGLAIAKAAVEAHGGELRAESAGLNRGATFSMALPLAGAAAEGP
ncbi:MAG: chemotaxis protein CheB [Chthoniobacteraceae bacterium]